MVVVESDVIALTGKLVKTQYGKANFVELNFHEVFPKSVVVDIMKHAAKD